MMNEPKADHVVMICRCIEDGEMRQVEVPSPPDHLADISASLRSLANSLGVSAVCSVALAENGTSLDKAGIDNLCSIMEEVGAALPTLEATSPPDKA